MAERPESSVAGLSPERQALLLRLLARCDSEPERPQAILRRAGPGPWPLSHAQQRLWFVHQMDQAGTVYNSPQAFALTGDLDALALEQALDQIQRRHESLRTAFPRVGETPCQVVLPHVPLRLPLVDLSGLPEPTREPEAAALAADEAERPFDLTQRPPLRVTLLRLEADRHVLLLNLHHIVFDGWSLGVLLRELGALYEAQREGRMPALPPLLIQAADFAVWQRERLCGELLERLVRFWTQHLQGAPPCLALPLDRPRPALQTWNGGRVTGAVPAALMAALRELALAEGASLFMVFLAAFEALLYRWSGQSDLVIGVTSAGRNRVESEGLITFLVNVLPLRLRLDGRSTFRELLSRLRRTALEVFAHEELPFDKVVEAVRPERSPSHSPLTQVLFAYQNTPLPSQLAGLGLAPVPVDHRRVKTDMVVSVLELEACATVIWAYNTDLFTATTLERLAAAYRELLATLAADPAVRIDEAQINLAPRRPQPMIDTSEPRDLRARRRRDGGRRALDLSEVTLVRTSSLRDGETLPLVVEPAAPDVDLVEWAAGHHDWIAAELLEHGALLFHGFRVRDVAEFECFASSLCPELFGEYGDLPPETGSTRIYRSTPYPPEETILFHNESSHLSRWPMKQLFFCLQAAERGGETPIVDCRRMARSLPPEILAPFAAKGLRYVRHFTDGLDVSWQDFLRTTDCAVAEERCREASLDFEWTRDGGLRLSHTGPAVTAHPRTGETVFFNQVQLHHVSCLPPAVRASLLASFGPRDLPGEVFFGDGSPIPDGVMEEVGRAYWANAVTFPWTEGDVLLLDNMLVAHARNPYAGARRIAVAMGEMFEQADLRS